MLYLELQLENWNANFYSVMCKQLDISYIAQCLTLILLVHANQLMALPISNQYRTILAACVKK
jgi:hypothetical protein